MVAVCPAYAVTCAVHSGCSCANCEMWLNPEKLPLFWCARATGTAVVVEEDFSLHPEKRVNYFTVSLFLH